MEFKLRELQAIESIIFEITSSFKSAKCIWTLKVYDEILQATALPYENGSPGYASYNSLYNAVNVQLLTGLFDFNQYFAKVSEGLSGRFNNFEAVSGWLINSPAELFLRCSKPEVLDILDLSKLDFLPPVLHNVTLLDSNKSLPFVVVDKDLPIQVISLDLIRKQN
ncbi:hypothetical protein [Veillonella seminalis]|uniref:Uncharacterized protein n=1 Tax=Veillonella seminalis ACS-216-V-Col6b TaxID=883156 RepID=K9D551_9FIRM|nr:hypothetical protein [Veillonella seminalis]EKU78311.1 hypothetical protein HMPREF9282_01217 [Veillonella seminalis ACS-216-V-Col6b]